MPVATASLATAIAADSIKRAAGLRLNLAPPLRTLNHQVRRRIDAGKVGVGGSPRAANRLLFIPERFRSKFPDPLDQASSRLPRTQSPAGPLNELVLGKRSLSTGLAPRLAIYIGTTRTSGSIPPSRYDLDFADRALRTPSRRGTPRAPSGQDAPATGRSSPPSRTTDMIAPELPCALFLRSVGRAPLRGRPVGGLNDGPVNSCCPGGLCGE